MDPIHLYNFSIGFLLSNDEQIIKLFVNGEMALYKAKKMGKHDSFL
jgi:GGDEF domain-containing protein